MLPDRLKVDLVDSEAWFETQADQRERLLTEEAAF